jgi:hypothetical protein
MDIGILEICLDARSHPPHSSTPRELCRIGLTVEESMRTTRIVLIVEVTLLIIELLGLKDEDGHWHS